MGIKNLNKLLRKYCPEIFERVHISDYSFKKIAIDVSLYLCKYKIICGEDNWLASFLNLVACLRKNEVHCVFIYDNGSPPEKKLEREARALQRKKTADRVKKLEEDLKIYHDSDKKIISEYLINIQKKIKNKICSPPRLLKKKEVSTDIDIDIELINSYLEKIKKYIVNIRSEDFLITKKII